MTGDNRTARRAPILSLGAAPCQVRVEADVQRFHWTAADPHRRAFQFTAAFTRPIRSCGWGWRLAHAGPVFADDLRRVRFCIVTNLSLVHLLFLPDANVHAVSRPIAMLLPLEGRRLYYDLSGPENGPVVCMTHSLMSDSGMWSEQMPTLLQAGYRVLRLDMRGHG